MLRAAAAPAGIAGPTADAIRNAALSVLSGGCSSEASWVLATLTRGCSRKVSWVLNAVTRGYSRKASWVLAAAFDPAASADDTEAVVLLRTAALIR
jgi:hypothetical protein